MSLQNESELEKAEEDILDKVQDCVYGLNLNVGGEEYKEILGQIKNSVWLRGEIQRVIKNILSQREQEIAEEVTKNLSKWIDGNVGVSSAAIYLWMSAGRIPRAFEAPSDEGDRKRCVVLLNSVPQWVNRLKEIESMRLKGTSNGQEVYPWNEQIPLVLSILNQ